MNENILVFGILLGNEKDDVLVQHILGFIWNNNGISFDSANFLGFSSMRKLQAFHYWMKNKTNVWSLLISCDNLSNRSFAMTSSPVTIKCPFL